MEKKALREANPFRSAEDLGRNGIQHLPQRHRGSAPMPERVALVISCVAQPNEFPGALGASRRRSTAAFGRTDEACADGDERNRQMGVSRHRAVDAIGDTGAGAIIGLREVEMSFLGDLVELWQPAVDILRNVVAGYSKRLFEIVGNLPHLR